MRPFTGRREDHRLVTGQGRYTADWSFPGQVFAAFVRSDVAHGIIVSIDVADAATHPGVLAVLTGVDMEREGARVPPPHPVRAGSNPVLAPLLRPIALGRVHHVGEPVAMVIAESAVMAQDAAELVAVKIDALAAVTQARQALDAQAPLLHEAVPGNICFAYEYGDRDAVEHAFTQAHHISHVELHAQRLVGNPLEPKGCTAFHDAQAGVYDIFCPTQGLSTTCERLAAGLGVAEENIRLHARDVGGAFGVRIEAYREYLAVAVAARLLGRPVKWVASRSETFLSDYHGRSVTMTGQLALDRDGRFLALAHDWLVDCGAYPSSSGAVVNAIAPSSYIVGPYLTPVVHGRHRMVLTNTLPTTPYRGSARPNVSYLVEALVDRAAREMGFSPAEIRRRNLIPPEAFPYTTPLGSIYDSGNPGGLMEKALDLADAASFGARRQQSAGQGRLRGLGIAVFVESAGGGRAPQEEVAIRIAPNGHVDLFTLSGSFGQGHETVFPQVVADVLGIPESLITLRPSDPEGPPLRGDGSIGSRSAMAHGSALRTAAVTLVEKGREMAAEQLEVSALDLRFEGGAYAVPGTDLSVSLLELVGSRPMDDKRHPLDSDASISVSQTFPSGAHVAEVEIDPETGECQVLAYVAVDDCGTVLNHKIVEGQVQGGIMQGFGQVFGEHGHYDSEGQLLSASFMDYFMPRAADAHPLTILDGGVPSPANPLGVKGVGEAGTTGAVPALSNAVLDALACVGVRSLDTPFTPSRLWQTIQQAKSNL